MSLFPCRFVILAEARQWPKAPQSHSFSHGLIAVVVLGFSKRTPSIITTDTGTCTQLHIKCRSVEIAQTAEDDHYVAETYMPVELQKSHFVYTELVSSQTMKNKANVVDSNDMLCFLEYSHSLDWLLWYFTSESYISASGTSGAAGSWPYFIFHQNISARCFVMWYGW